jgi:hypothetical protein
MNINREMSLSPIKGRVAAVLDRPRLPAENIPARVMNTRSLGLRSSRAFSGFLLAELQDGRIRLRSHA